MHDHMEASPMKALTEELDQLRVTLRATIQNYVQKTEDDIAQIQAAVDAQIGQKKISSDTLRDLRDMLTLLHQADIKPEKGRRKDFKKIDTIVADLTMLTESWRKT